MNHLGRGDILKFKKVNGFKRDYTPISYIIPMFQMFEAEFFLLLFYNIQHIGTENLELFGIDDSSTPYYYYIMFGLYIDIY